MGTIAETKWVKNCSRWGKCSIPICPLDPDQELRVKLPGDPKCTISKNLRYRLGEGLPLHGLTKKEYAGRKLWEALSEDEKEKVRKRVRERFEKSPI